VGRLEFGPLGRKVGPDQIIIPMGMRLAGLPIGNWQFTAANLRKKVKTDHRVLLNRGAVAMILPKFLLCHK
jgi:hypothetical protein